MNNLLHGIPLPPLPEFTSVKSLCDHFSRYFVDKIETIRSKFPDKPALASIMTQNHAKDLCASELGPLRILAL